jgi:hypothetical protein
VRRLYADARGKSTTRRVGGAAAAVVKRRGRASRTPRTGSATGPFEDLS